MSIDNNAAQPTQPGSMISNQGKAMKIILGIVAVIIIGLGLIFYFTSGLSDVAHEQLAELKSGNIESAYNMTSKEFQQSTSLDKFKSFVEQYPIIKSYKSVSFTERKIESGKGYISGTIENTDGKEMKIEYLFVKEDNKWKIQGMQLSPMEKN